MRLYRVRFTIRCMMVAVATVGFVLGSCIVLKRRSDEFAAEAESHSKGVAVVLLNKVHVNEGGGESPQT